MSRFSRLGKNTALVFVGKLGSSIIGFLMLPLYTRWLGLEAFGKSDLINVYSSFLIILITCCISESIFIFPKDKERSVQTAYFTSSSVFLLSMFVLTALVLALIQMLSHIFDAQNIFIEYIWLIYIVSMSSALQQFFQQFTRSIDRMFVYSMTGLINAVSIAILAFVFIPQMGLIGYVLSLAAASLISGVYSFIASRSYEYIAVKTISKELIYTMLKYSIPLIPNGIMWWLVSSLNRPLMEQHLGISEIGIYAVANRIPAILTIVFGVFSTSWQISVLEEFGKEGFSEFYNRVFRLIFGLLLVLLVVITLSSKIIVTLLASNDFYEAWRYVPLLTLGSLLANVSSFCGTVFSATKESKYFFYSSILGAITSIVFNYLLIPTLGTYGVCIAFVLSFIAMAGSRIIFSGKYAKIDNICKDILLLSFTVIIIVLFLFDTPLVFLLGLTFLLFFFIYQENKQEYPLLLNLIKSKQK